MGRDLDNQSQYHYQSRLAVHHIDLGGEIKKFECRFSTDNLPKEANVLVSDVLQNKTNNPHLLQTNKTLFFVVLIKTSYEHFTLKIPFRNSLFKNKSLALCLVQKALVIKTSLASLHIFFPPCQPNINLMNVLYIRGTT